MQGTSVLVTGASGFLGQHVVKLLQTRAEHVKEIKVLDVIPFVNKLEYEEKKPVHSTVGSITNAKLVQDICKNVDCVMHLASCVDVSLFPDEEKSYQVNVEGTRNVIAACRKHCVKRLIYCSSGEVVRDRHNIYNGTEDNIPTPKEFLLKTYGSTKKQAEDLVIAANCSSLSTICLRPLALYGELEPRMNTAITDSYLGQLTGYYMTLDLGKGQTSFCYAGNCAWAFLCADKTLQDDPKLRNAAGSRNAAGNAYFIMDHTEAKNSAELLIPIAKQAGYTPFPLRIPCWLMIYLMSVIYFLLKLISPIHEFNSTFGVEAFQSMLVIFQCNYEKAKVLLGYNPIYTYEEAKNLTAAYLIKMKHKQ